MLPLSLLIGIRFSYAYPRNRIISSVPIISVIAIIFGVTAVILGLSTINGFERELNNRILAVIPHGEIKPISQPWDNWKESLMNIEKLPDIVAVSPYISFTGLIETGSNLQVIQVKGVNPNQEVYLSTLPKFVKNNAWCAFQPGKQQIIIGKGIADVLKVKQDDWISVSIPNTNNNCNVQQLRHIRLRIIGIFQLNGQLDHSFAMVPLDDARRYLGMGDSVTGIAIKVNDAFNIDKLVYNIEKVIKDYVHIKSWINTYGYIYHDIQMVRSIMYLVMILVIGVACFNIVSTLMIVVKNKIGDIAILRTIGAKNRLICAIFFWYGLLIGLIGSLCGIVIGAVISIQLTSIISIIERIIGHQFLSSNIYFIDFLPSELHWKDIIYVLIMVSLLSLLASLYPAYRANCIDPARVLNNQ